MSDKFTGKERDQETGNDYFIARYMSGAQGRFLSPDPMNAGADPADPQSWNAYSYVGNNPLARIDPNGLSWFSDLWKGVSNWFSGCGSDFCVTGTGFADRDPVMFDPGYGISGGGGSGANQQQLPPPPKVVNISQAPAALSYKLKHLSSTCGAALPTRTTLNAKANRLNFWDGRTDGQIPVSLIPGSVGSNPNATLGSELGDNNAVTLWGPRRSISSNVVLGTGFFNKEAGNQGITLLHELLHYTLQKDDEQINAKYRN